MSDFKCAYMTGTLVYLGYNYTVFTAFPISSVGLLNVLTIKTISQPLPVKEQGLT